MPEGKKKAGNVFKGRGFFCKRWLFKTRRCQQLPRLLLAAALPAVMALSLR